MNTSPATLTRRTAIISWIFQLAPAFILLQTLYFKFTAAPETVYIFKVVGLGAAGRIGTGVVELIAGICLLIPRFAWLGAVLAMGTLMGAIAAHLGPLGITFDYPGGYEDGSLFTMACIAWVSSAIVLFIRRRSIPIIGAKFFGA